MAIINAEELTFWDVGARRIVTRQRCQTAGWVAADPTGRFVPATTSGGMALFDARAMHGDLPAHDQGHGAVMRLDSTGTGLTVSSAVGVRFPHAIVTRIETLKTSSED